MTDFPQASIDPSAKIGRNVSIGPFTVIGPNVTITDGVTIGPNCSIGTAPDAQVTIGTGATISDHCSIGSQLGNGAHNITIDPSVTISSGCVIARQTHIGEETKIGANSIIGSEAGDKTYDPNEPSGVHIGSHCHIGDNCIIQSGTHKARSVLDKDALTTHIDDNCYIGGACGIGHDSQIGRGATLVCAKLGGMTRIGANAYLGLGATTHPRSRIGEGALIGMNGAVDRDILPYSKAVGIPARHIGVNDQTAVKAGFSEQDIARYAQMIERARKHNASLASALKAEHSMDKAPSITKSLIAVAQDFASAHSFRTGIADTAGQREGISKTR